jgi:hypothetical protein
MICFRFSSESSGKIETGSLDLLDDPTLLEEIVDDVLTSALGKLIGPILEESPEELPLRCFTETWVEGTGAVDAFTSGKIFSEISVILFFGRGAPAEISEIEDSSFGDV